MKLKPPWFFCCGWWSPWCVLDEYAHRLFAPGSHENLSWPLGFLCDKHDAAVTRHHERKETA